MPVLAAGPGASATALWNLSHGASQLLVLPVGAQISTRIVVLPGAEAGIGALGVAASLLRHIPAESVLLAIHEASTPIASALRGSGSCSTRDRRRSPSMG